MPTILGIDPGALKSGWVLWNTETGSILSYGYDDNEALSESIYSPCGVVHVVAIEMLTGYGVVAGDDTFQTCRWMGRFEEAAVASLRKVLLISRKEIKRALCGNVTTNDKYVRMALIDRVGPQGSKRDPGPTYGISGHAWAALAAAIVAADKIIEGGKV